MSVLECIEKKNNSTLFAPICCEIQAIPMVFIALVLFMLTFAFDVTLYNMWLFFVADGIYKAMIEVGKINLHWFGHKILKIKQLKLPASQLHKRLIQCGFETFHTALNSVSPLHWWNKYEGAWSSIRINIYPSMGWDFDGRVSLWLSERQTDVSSWRQQTAECTTNGQLCDNASDSFFVPRHLFPAAHEYMYE